MAGLNPNALEKIEVNTESGTATLKGYTRNTGAYWIASREISPDGKLVRHWWTKKFFNYLWTWTRPEVVSTDFEIEIGGKEIDERRIIKK